MTNLRIIQGDALEVLKGLERESVNCCVTSPPYYGLRDYGVAGQIGLEPTLDEYLARLVAVFGEVRRVLRGDGVCFVNIGDSYAGGGNYRGVNHDTLSEKQGSNRGAHGLSQRCGVVDLQPGLKPKDRLLVPFRLALALQADGWWMRDVICWAKRAPMPESVTDRCTQAWEPILMLTKSAKYYWNQEAVKEPSAYPDKKPYDTQYKVNGERDGENSNRWSGLNKIAGEETRNLRNFWLLSPECYPEAHFATFPTEIPKRCILAACPVGGIVLDPFGGSGTTGMVALELGRRAVLIELNEDYVKLAQRRCDVTPGLPF